MDDSEIGGNKSAEADDEDNTEDLTKTVVNLVSACKLEEDPTITDKKEFNKQMKLYIGKLVEYIKETKPDYLDTFKANARKAIDRILNAITDDWKFYRGEGDHDGKGMLVILGYREDRVTPYMLFFKDGLIEEKAVRFFVCAVSKVKF